MNRRGPCFLFILAVCVAVTPVMAQSPKTPNTLSLDASSQPARATLNDMKLLVGHWQGDFLGGVAEELWLPPAGGAMVGVFRLVSQGRVEFYELMTLSEDAGTVVLTLKHFGHDLAGWEEKGESQTFRLVRAEKGVLWFDGLTYRRLPDGSLGGAVAIRSRDGKVRDEVFVLKPTRSW